MQEFSSSTSFDIRPAGTTELAVGSSHVIAVERGQVWLTRRGDSMDYWLGAGETLTLAGGERLWLSTDSGLPARVTLTRRARCDERLWSWLAARLRGASGKPRVHCF